VKRGAVDRVALRRAQELLSAGQHTLMIAPEGRRSGSGALQAGHNGLAFIAIRSHAWIVPIAVTGVQSFWRNVFSLRKTPVTVRIGRGFRFIDNGDKIDRNTMQMMTQEAMYQLAALLPEDHRGAYADLGQATTDHLEFAT
jgi:1-acyl-sn-glycerol-3-phosphate acyltransferase